MEQQGVRQRRTMPAEVGRMLAEARMRAGFRLREAERLLDVTHPYLLRLETGERTPSVTVAERIAGLLDLTEDERTQLLAVAVTDAGTNHPGKVPASSRSAR